MNSKQFFRTYQTLILHGGIILVVFFTALYGLYPAFQTTYAMVRRVQSVEKENVELRNKAALLVGMDEEVLKKQLFDLVSAVPRDKSLPTVLSTLDGVSQQSGVSISNFLLAEAGGIGSEAAKLKTAEEKKLGSSKLSFTVAISGNVNQVRSFLATVIAVRRLLRVDQFTMTFSDQTSANFRLTMSAYYAPLVPSIGKVEGKLVAFTDKEQSLVDAVGRLPLFTGTSASSAPAVQPQFGTVKNDPFSP